MTFNHFGDLGFRIVRQSFGVNLGDVLDLQQVADASEFFQFALVQNGNAIANVLHIGQLVAA